MMQDELGQQTQACQQERNQEAQVALQAAREFLSYWRDDFTRRDLEELSQEAVVSALERRHTLRDASKFPAYVRTVARRVRQRALRQHAKEATRSLDSGSEWGHDIATNQDDVCVLVGDVWADKQELLGLLDVTLQGLSPLNKGLLRSYYEGFSCSELAVRYGLSPVSVRVRLHRSRKRIKLAMEANVTVASGSVGSGHMTKV